MPPIGSRSFPLFWVPGGNKRGGYNNNNGNILVTKHALGQRPGELLFLLIFVFVSVYLLVLVLALLVIFYFVST